MERWEDIWVRPAFGFGTCCCYVANPRPQMGAASTYGRSAPTAAGRQMDRPKQERRHHGHPAGRRQVYSRNS